MVHVVHVRVRVCVRVCACTCAHRSPKNMPSGAALPVHIQIHGGGFTSGSPDEQITTEIEAYVAAGFHYMSVGYRLVATKYYYHTQGDAPVEEEFIHAAANGTLTLDTAGRVLSDYKIRRGRTEYNTKCSYDAALVHNKSQVKHRCPFSKMLPKTAIRDVFCAPAPAPSGAGCKTRPGSKNKEVDPHCVYD